MKAPPFAYARAGDADEAVALLAEAGDEAKVLAGGQSLLPLLAYRLVRPTHLVDVGGASRLGADTSSDGDLVLDALTRHVELERSDFDGAHALLRETAALIGHVPIRARGTLGGSLAHADPAAELPVAAVALDATVVVRSAAGERAIPAASFFIGPFTTALEPGELITSVIVPESAPGARCAFEEFAIRAGDFALASVAVVAEIDSGVIRSARVVVGGVDVVPLRVEAAEESLVGRTLDADVLADAAAAASAACDPAGDRLASAQYRRELVAVLTRRALERCAA